MTSSNFDSRVVVTSAQTSVDIPALMQAISRVGAIFHEFEWSRDELRKVADSAHSAHTLCSPDVRCAAEYIDMADRALAIGMQRLEHFSESLSYAALIYAAAEGDAAAFAHVRALLYPSVISYIEAGSASIPLNAASVVQKPIGTTMPWKSRGKAQQWREIFPRSFQQSAAYAALYGAVFATGAGSDPVDSLAMQFHIEEASRSVVGSSGWLSQVGELPEQEWGAFAARATPEAAAIAGGALFGWGRLLYGDRHHLLLGRPSHEAPGSKGQGAQVQGVGMQREAPGKAAQMLRLPLSPQSTYRSRTVIPGAPGFSRFLNLGQDLGALPESTLNGLPERKEMGGNLDNSVVAAASVKPVPIHAAHRVLTPHEPSTLIDRIGQLAEGQEYGEFEILKHETQGPRGVERSWSVIIRGTQEWGAGSTNIQDMHTNFNAIAGLESDQTRAIKAAMIDAGIDSAEPVEFVGHSQGGIVAAQLASDAQIHERYRVAAALTVGAPTAGYNPDLAVGMLSLENTRDQVPALDGAENSDRGRNLTVHFDGHLLGVKTGAGEEAFAHDMPVYEQAMKHFESAPTEGTSEVTTWMEARQRELGLARNTRTTSYVYTTQRSSK